MKLIKWNPELQRNLWETITPTKLIVMPVILILIFFITGSASQLYMTSIILFYIITIMVGSYLAGEEIPNEVQEKTWDWQRMSALTPLQMTIGKLFGSTIYQWYGGIICLVVLIYSSFQLDNTFWYTIQVALTAVLAATFFHSFAMILGIVSRDMPFGLRRVISIFILLSLSSFLIVVGTVIIYSSYVNRGLNEDIITKQINWFFIKLPLLTHILFFFIFLNIWSFWGLYRCFRTEMYYFNKPDLFAIFLLALPFYISGFYFNLPEKYYDFKVYLTFLFAGIAWFSYNATFLTAFLDKMEIINFRRLFFHLKQNNYEKALYDVPLWSVSLIIQIVSSFIALILFTISSQDLHQIEPEIPLKILFFLIVVNLFCIRDIGIFMINHFTQGKNAIGISIAYLFILYYILPAILITTGNNHLLPACYPLPFTIKDFEFKFINIAIPFLEALIVVLIVRKIWITKNQKVQESILKK